VDKKARIQFLFSAISWVVLLSFLATACSTSPVPANEAPESYEPVLSGSDADPQRIEFQAEDGKKLVGYYYPSKYENAPVMILMHWSEGDLCDWSDVAVWLQNRAGENPARLERCANAGGNSWRNPSWFPPMTADASIAVFIFDFRGHGESETGEVGPDLGKDAKAAFKAAAGFPDVDSTRLAAIGASLGADGASTGCLLYNQEMGAGCVGAFSISPGNYPGMQYSTAIGELAPVAALCVAGEQDIVAAQTCASADRKYYADQIYPGSAVHGMALLSPTLDPSPLTLIQIFIGLAFGEDVQVK
jgi:hypothetical protein